MTRLAELLEPLRVVSVSGPTDIEVTGVATDSRLVRPGNLFVCLPGYRSAGGESLSDRHGYAEQAVRDGAAAVLVQRELPMRNGATVVRVDNTWDAAASAAAHFHGHPSRRLYAVGITGTSGKTSTSFFADAVLRAAGHRVARMGTVGYRIGDESLPAEQTTPESPIVHGLLRRAVDTGCTAAAMEVSSHALELRRVGDVYFDAAVFTNLGRDHLNFHSDMESYRAAKARLFTALGEGGKQAVAIVNADDPEWRHLLVQCRAPVLSYGFGAAADVRADAVRASMGGLEFTLYTPRESVPVRMPHLGDYNVHNALAAAALGSRLGMSAGDIAAALAAAEPVPGRFELIRAGQPFAVVIDYAHKPSALERLLASARRLQPRRLITVVGCGGDRDRGKRPLMGKIAADNSDLVFVTSDNPRSEDPRAIITEILEGSRASDADLERHRVEVDRAQAIRSAIGCAAAGDMVVIAGKGHEPYQLIGGRRFDFDDREHARQALVELGLACES